MSLFKKLFSSDPEALEKKADQLFEAGDFGSAKMTYEKALDAADSDAKPRLEDKVARSTDGIARRRIEEGNAHLKRGEIELAVHEFEGAKEVAADDALREQAQALIDGIEADSAIEQAVAHEMTDEERLAVLIGQWEDAQADEYDQHGEPLFDALVAMQKEEFAEAREALEALLSQASAPRFLWLEVGRARLLTDDVPAAEEAFGSFVESLSEDEGGENRLAAHLALARIAEDREDFDAAMSNLEGAVEAMPEDYRPYLAMGNFLRAKGHASESLEVLETALELNTAKSQADWRLLQELGLAHHQAGNDDKAVSFYQQVVEFFNGHQLTDYPTLTATHLAELHEKAGHADKAADLYRALSQGSDTENHALYHYEAGRLLREIDLQDEAHRMLTRAKALAEGDNELSAKIDAIL